MVKVKTLYVWKDDMGTIFRDTAVVSTNQHVSEDDWCSRRTANRELFKYWCGSRFPIATDYFCEKFAEMARENGWKLEQIELPNVVGGD